MDQPTLARTAVALLQGYPCDLIGFAVSGRVGRHEDPCDQRARPTGQHWDVLQLAELRNRQDDPRPITRREVDLQVTVNGVDSSVLDGHLWGFLNLNLTNQAKEVFNNVPSMHGLEVWRRLIGELLPLTDLRQMDLQTVVYAPAWAATLQRIRSAIEN